MKTKNITFHLFHSRVWLFEIFLLILFFQSQIFPQQFTKITSGSHVNDLAASRSVNWIDYDGDGDLDLFVSRGKEGGQNNMMYINNGVPSYTFTKMDTMIISRDNQPSDGSSWGDTDNDGDPDLFVVNWYGRNNMYYVNNGRGQFTQVTTGNLVTDGGYSETCSWGDYNNDGLLDLYVSNSAGTLKNFLYKNLGNNQFQKIITGTIVNDARHTRGVNWVDYDNDGDLDMFATNEENENENLYKNMLTETGVDTFASITTGLLVTSGGSSWSGSWGDYDNDGDLDVFVTNWGFQRNRLFRNDGGGVFDTVSAGTLTSEQDYFATASWVDYDNDGDLDIFVTNAYGGNTKCSLYKNELMETGLTDFTKITTEQLVNELGFWYGVSWADYDNDGDMDVYVAGTLNENAKNIFYRNNGTPNKWLTLDCIGTLTNKSAIGTKVKVKANINGNFVWQLREIDGQSGYCGQTLQQHFGLGDATVIDSLVIEWLSGQQQVFTNVSVNHHYIIVENDSTALGLASPENESMNSNVSVNLKWHGKFWTAPYRVQVATDSTFSSGIIVDDTTVTDTTLSVFVQSNQSVYYWRVQSLRTMYPNIWSAVWKFTNNLAPPVLPILDFPSNGDSNRSIMLSMKWRRATNASIYHLRISQDSGFTSVMFEDSLITDTSKTVSPLSNKTKYYWRVRSGNVSGYSTFSSSWNFSTIVDTPMIPVLQSPTNGAVEVQQTPLLIWNQVEDALTYRLQVAADSLFSTIVVDIQNIADTNKQVPLLNGFTKYFWRVRSTNIGGTSAYSAGKSFRTILATPVLQSPSNGSHQPPSLQFDWFHVDFTERYVFQIATDSLFVNVQSTDTILTDTFKVIDNLSLGSRYYWRLRAERTESISGWSSPWWFDADVTTMNVQVSERWNLVSLPLLLDDARKDVLFPTSISQAFTFHSSGYAVAETLKNGMGYWLKFDSSQSIIMNGTLQSSVSTDVHEGWNLVGSLSQPIAVSQIVSVPGGIVTSEFYEYTNGYVSSNSLQPGKGYWVKTNQAGQLILSSVSNIQSLVSRIQIVSTIEFPPPPPEGDGNSNNAIIPSEYILEQNYPNPFNPSTVIRYQLPVDSWVTLKVYNTLGEEVATLVDETQDAGFKMQEWNASGLPSGIYWYKIQAGKFSDINKLILLK